MAKANTPASKKASYQISEDVFEQIVADYYSGVRYSTKHLSEKYGYHFASIARKMRKRGYKLRSNSESQIGLVTGENHPNYKTGEDVGISEYKRLKADVVECEWCGSTKRLLVHHIDHNHYNNDIDNLAKICQSCHTTHHNKHRKIYGC